MYQQGREGQSYGAKYISLLGGTIYSYIPLAVKFLIGGRMNKLMIEMDHFQKYFSSRKSVCGDILWEKLKYFSAYFAEQLTSCLRFSGMKINLRIEEVTKP